MRRERLSLMTFNMNLDILLRKMSIRDTMELAKEESIPYVDLMQLKGKKIPRYLAAMKETGIKAGCYVESVSFLSGEADLRTHLRKALKTTQVLSAQRLMIVPYSGLGDLRRFQQMARDQVLQKMIDGFQTAVQEGEAAGIPVCFETTPHDELCLSGAEDCLSILRTVNGLGLVFDTANMLSHGDDPLTAYETLKQYIVHVHLKDVALEDSRKSNVLLEHSKDGRLMRCVVWGEGVVPIAELYRRMNADGYEGLFAIEYNHPAKFLCGPEEHLAHLRRFGQALEKAT